eukprot:12070645-Alexandrium_andersonii.AAC.1
MWPSPTVVQARSKRAGKHARACAGTAVSSHGQQSPASGKWWPGARGGVPRTRLHAASPKVCVWSH